ncbi:MAG: FemAB family PEP-CTERM system-associated protein [Gammaproteobacteria bacterium]|nr:FemAB family PEP-CTERM system-associated protein [Gammaproteobacteria bacterium]
MHAANASVSESISEPDSDPTDAARTTATPDTCHQPLSIAEAELDGGDRVAWDDFVASHPQASLYHGSAWHDVICRSFGHRGYALWATRGQRCVGVLPLVRLRSRLFGDYMVSIPFVNYGGALGEDAAIEQALMHVAAKRARSLGVGHIEFRDHRSRDTELAVRTDKVVMELPLDADPEVMRKRFGAKLRSQIKRPLREGAVARIGHIELLDDFYQVFSRNMRDLGTPVYARSFFATVLERMADKASVVLIHLGGRPAAAGLLLTHAGRTEIPWASSLREFNRESVNMLLYDTCIAHACERGSTIFDFGRSSIDSGTYRFKKQWGAEPLQLHWHYWLADGQSMPGLTPDNPKFRLAIAVWQRLPVSLTNLIGPAIVRNLP